MIFLFVLLLIFFVKVQSAEANVLPVQCRSFTNGRGVECTADASQCVGELVVNVSANWTAGNCLPGACNTHLEIAFQGAGPYIYGNGQGGGTQDVACQPNSSGTVSFSGSSTFTGGWVTTSAGIGAPQFDGTQVGGINNTTTVECKVLCGGITCPDPVTQCVGNGIATTTYSCVNNVCEGTTSQPQTCPDPTTQCLDDNTVQTTTYSCVNGPPVACVANPPTTNDCADAQISVQCNCANLDCNVDTTTNSESCELDTNSGVSSCVNHQTISQTWCGPATSWVYSCGGSGNNTIIKTREVGNCSTTPAQCTRQTQITQGDICGAYSPTGNVRCGGGGTTCNPICITTPSSKIQIEESSTMCVGGNSSCQPGGPTRWKDLVDCGPPSDTSFSWCDPGGVKCTLTTNYPGMCQGSPTSGTSATCVAPTVDLICGGPCTNTCTPGSTQSCTGGGNQTCDANGQWGACDNGSHNICSTSKQCISVAGGGANQCQNSTDCGNDNNHNECNTSKQCIVVAGAGSDQCSNNNDCGNDTHNECNNSNQCVAVSSPGPDQCQSDDNCENGSHTECNTSKQCITISTSGTDQCSTNDDCSSNDNHNVCNISKQCINVSGPGSDQCSNNSECGNDTHNECNASDQCIVVSGNGTDECQASSDCTKNNHSECNSSKQCVSITGPGVDRCSTNSDCNKSYSRCNSSNQCTTTPGIGSSTCTTNESCTLGSHRICNTSNQCVVAIGPGSDQCQDGEDCINSTHNECNASKQCIAISGMGTDTCQTNSDCTNNTYYRCNYEENSDQCIAVPGISTNKCTADSCVSGMHNLCNTSNQCVSVPGSGPDGCQINSDCVNSTHNECSGQQCAVVDGFGDDLCQSQGDCASCTPRSVKSCTNGGTQTCDYSGKWGTCYYTIGICRTGNVRNCIYNGTRTCNFNGQWGPCLGPCTSGTTSICEDGKIQTCTNNQWGSCIEPPCTPGENETCEGGGSRTCDSDSKWGSCIGPCTPEQTEICEDGFTQICDANGQWEPCPDLIENNLPPEADQLTAQPGGSCTGIQGTGIAYFQWVYIDQEGDTEKGFTLQVDNNSEFSSPEVYRTFSNLSYPTGTLNQQVVFVKTDPAVPSGDNIQYNVDYYWRVMVQEQLADSSTQSSDWIESPGTFKISGHPAPAAEFAFTPSNPAPGILIDFSDASICYNNTGPVACTSYLWNFGDGGPSSSAQNLTYTYSAAGTYNADLQVCDNDGNCCSAAHPVQVKVPGGGGLPNWKEISPF